MIYMEFVGLCPDTHCADAPGSLTPSGVVRRRDIAVRLKPSQSSPSYNRYESCKPI